MRVLVTGANGNVGREVVRQLTKEAHDVFAGIRHVCGPLEMGVTSVQVDFEKRIGPEAHFDAIFLMRPPHLADPALFEEFLERYDRKTRIIFLSVQGAGSRSFLPHAKIENKIKEMGFRYVFVRPSYFMDNLLTTLWSEMERNQRIYLPAGNLQLDWVSVRDVASVSVAAITGAVGESSVTVCSGVGIGFAETCEIINRVTGTKISYQPAGLLGFVLYSRRNGVAWSYIGVMLLLHYLPRFQKQEFGKASAAKTVLKRDLETLEEFVSRNRDQFTMLQ